MTQLVGFLPHDVGHVLLCGNKDISKITKIFPSFKLQFFGAVFVRDRNRRRCMPAQFRVETDQVSDFVVDAVCFFSF